MKIGQWNIRSAIKNRSSLLNIINEFKPDIICLCETWLNPNLNFNINHYNTIRNDRVDGYGGIAILLHETITFKILSSDTPSIDGLEYIAALVSAENINFTLISLYLPPGNIVSKENWLNFFNSFPPPLVVAGDFNCHHETWGSSKTNKAGESLLNAIIESKLIFYNNEHPTTVTRPGECPSVIDLTLISDVLPVIDWQIIPHPYGSDHYPIIFQIIKNNVVRKVKSSSKLQNGWNEKNVDWEQFEDKLYLKFLFRFVEDDFAPHNILQSFSKFIKDIVEVNDQYLKKKFYVNNSTILFPSLPPWWNKECQELVDK